MENITELQNKINSLNKEIREYMGQIKTLESEYDYKVSIRCPHMKVGTQDYLDYNNDLNRVENEIEILWAKIKLKRAEIGVFDLKISEIKLKNNKNVDYFDTTKRNCVIMNGEFCYYDNLTELPREDLRKDASIDFYFCDTFAGKTVQAYYPNGKTIFTRVYSLIHDVDNGVEKETVIAKDVKSVDMITLYFVKNNPQLRIEIDMISGKKYYRGFNMYWSSEIIESFNEEQRELVNKAIKIMGDELCYKEEIKILKELL